MTGTTRPRRFLLLGANGKLGTLVQAVWRAHPFAGCELVPVARRGNVAGSLDWSPGQSLADLGQADVVLALWGVTQGPEVAQNVSLAQSARDVAAGTGARCVVHLSSAAVYGRHADPGREDDVVHPENLYGKAKRDMEGVIAGFDDGLVHRVLRVGNVAGADSLFAALTRPGPIMLDRFPDGTGPVRSFLTARTLAEALVALCDPERAVPAPLNLAEALPVSMADIVRAAGKKLEWKEAPETAVQRSVLDTTRLQTLLWLDPERATASSLVEDWRRWQSVLA